MKHIDAHGSVLIVGKQYLLRTHDLEGFEQPRSEWIRATWDGTRLLDADGVWWNEWLCDPEDIIDPEADPASA